MTGRFSLAGLAALAVLWPLYALSQSAGDAADPVSRWEADRTTVFEAAEIDLGAFEWIARPLVVFADSPAVPAFQDQMALIEERADTLAERDVVVITDTDPATMSDVRRELRPRGFQLTIIGKDGRVAQRKPFPWSVREITRAIDKMPIRQQELRAGG